MSGFFSWISQQINDIDDIAHNLTQLKRERYLEIMDELSVAKNTALKVQALAGRAAEHCRRTEDAYARCCERVEELEKLARDLR